MVIAAVVHIIKEKKMKKFVVTAFLIGMAALTFAQTLKIASIAPARSAWEIEAKRLAQEWAKQTGGRVTMQFLNTNALGGEDGVIQKLNSVRPGQKAPIDGGIFTNLGMASMAPDAHILTLSVPFLLRDQEEVDLVYEAFKPQVSKEFQKKGQVLLGYFPIGWAYYFTKSPVRTPEELKKLRLCVSGMGVAALTDAYKLAGYTTMDVPSSKMLSSMKSPGGVEGFYTIPMYGYAAQYYKAVPYILNVPFTCIMVAFIVSEKSWNSIPAEDRPKLVAAFEEAQKKLRAATAKSDEEYLDLLRKAGATVVDVTPAERNALEESMRHDSFALAKTGVMDQKFYDDVVALLKKHRGE